MTRLLLVTRAARFDRERNIFRNFAADLAQTANSEFRRVPAKEETQTRGKGDTVED
jgi:hypothetical protein